MNIVQSYAEMLQWLEWDGSRNYPIQLAVQLTISTLQYLMGNSTNSTAPATTTPQHSVNQQQVLDQQRFYAAVHVICLCEQYIRKLPIVNEVYVLILCKYF